MGMPERFEALAQNIVGVDGSAFPPVLRRREFEDGKVQMGRVFRGIARRADVTNNLALLDLIALFQASGIPFEVGVVVAVLSSRVELINGGSPSLTLKEPGDRAVFDRLHRGVARGENVDRVVRTGSAAPILERAHQLLGLDPLDRDLETPSR